MRRVRWALGLLFAGLLGVIAFGMWAGFPVWDDAYMVLFLRESGLEALEAAHPNRPLYGLLLKGAAAAFGLHRAPYVAAAVAFWALLAWQTGRLSRRLLPGEPTLVPLAALLTLAPVLVTTQYTTATTVLPVNLPVSLCLAALLIGLGSAGRGGPVRALGAAALVGLAVAISEYGIAAGSASAALLGVRRRFREAAWVVGGMVVGYAVFHATGNLGVRAKQMPSVQVARLVENPLGALVRFLEGIWHALLGAWAGAASDVRMNLGSRSTLLAALAAVMAGVIFVWFDRRMQPEVSSAREGWPWPGLVAAVAAGILPVALANRPVVSADPYESRYLLPVLPFASIAVAAGVTRLTVPRFRSAMASAAAALAAYWIVLGAFQARSLQARLDELGGRLRPLLEKPGIVVAVVPDMWRLEGADLTPKVTWTWTDDEARRLWVIPERTARVLFGPRAGCHGTRRIETPPDLLSTGRNGEVSHLVWVSPWEDAIGDLQPYCVGSAP